jgi:hypothetical protein
MAFTPNRITEIAAQIREGKTPNPETVGTLIAWFGAQRRGFYVVQQIR